jgi:geranylgeranyl diphosphate synthase type II
MLRVKELQELVEKRIAELDFNKQPTDLYAPMGYILGNKGKRIRPVMTLLACELFSGNLDEALDAAIGLEVFHNFTLLHDDIMDNAPVRRGQPTVHEKWNDNVAILSGDAMMVEAYKLMANIPDNSFRAVFNLFSETALGVCEGQQYDMDFEDRDDVKEQEYIEMIRLKTSVLLAACLKTGAIIAGASKEDADHMYQFGLNIGLAFQLKDDWLDVYGDVAVFGKKTGGDIVENKKTFMLIKAKALVENGQQEELDKWIQAKDFNEQEKIKAVTALYNELNIGQLALAEAEKYAASAFNELDKVSVPNERKETLRQLGQYLIYREK